MTRRRSFVLAAAAGCALAAVPGVRSASLDTPDTVVGRSALGKPIRAVEVGTADRPRRVLVVGCIHGNETAGISIARRLIERAPPATVDLWVIPSLNPDGVAANTRQNAHGVDLNRNFPWHWRRLGRRGDQQYSGTQPLSEPEARFAQRLILRLRPQITIWFHQPLAVVDQSGGDPRIERSFARLTGLPLTRLPRYPGSAASWQDQTLAGTTAFVVELPPGQLSARAAERYTTAVLELTTEAPRS